MWHRIVLLFSLWPGAASLPGCAPGPARAAIDPADAVDLDLGAVRPGGRATGTLRLTNPSAESWRVARVESSCPCVAVAPAAFEVAPGGSIALAVTCDLVDEPDFRGGLAVALAATAADGAVVRTARVALTVAD